MAELKNVRSSRVGLTFAQLGTFWTQTFRDSRQIRRLVATMHQTSALTEFESTANNLAGVPAEKDAVSNLVVRYNKSDVFRTGDKFYDDPRLNYGTEQSYPGVYDGGNTEYWVMPVKQVIPLAIQAKGRRLVVGIDFFVHLDKWLFFRDNPAVLFDNEQFLCLTGRHVRTPWLLEYPIQAAPADTTRYVVDYARLCQSPRCLELALASVAGLKILSAEQKLVSKVTEFTHTVYTFEQEVLRVDYEHPALVVGETYPKDFIIGDAIKVYPGGPTNPAWWRAIDWRGGLSTEPIIDFRGLFLKDEDVTAYAAGTESDSVAGSKVHARMDLTGNDAELPYWDEVARRETAQGFFLNTVLGLLTDQQVRSARIEDPGTGYAVDDTITLLGGTYTIQAILRVTAVDSGVITAVEVENFGAYTVTPENPVLQGTTSGSGVGAEFTILWEYSDDPYAALVEEMTTVNQINTALNLPHEQLNPRRLPHTKLVNPIDIFFLAVLNPRCLVITIDQAVVKNQEELFRYLSRELPIGVLSIIFAYAPRLPEEIFGLEDSEEEVEITEFNADDQQTPSEEFSLSGSEEFVSIVAEEP